MNLLKDELQDIHSRVDKIIDRAAVKLSAVVDSAADKISEQRSLTREDVEHLIRFAAHEFGTTLDVRIEKIRGEASELITSKIAQVRVQLTEAATEQKRVAVRNATVAISASILVGIISLLYKKMQGDLDLMSVFRSTLLALSAGYLSWLTFRAAQRYINAPRLKRNAIVVGVRYFEVLRPRGAVGHVFVLALVLLMWALFTYPPAWLGELTHFLRG